MILFLSAADARALRSIPAELSLIRAELSGVRCELVRIAAALESQPEARVPTGVAWHHAAPKEE